MRIESEEFDALLSKIEDAKHNLGEWQKHLDFLKDELKERFSEIDPTSDYEGTETLESDRYTVKITHKITRTIDKEKAKEIIWQTGLEPEKLFTVDYKYSATKYKEQNDENRKHILDCTVAKRAKAEFKFTRR